MVTVLKSKDNIKPLLEDMDYMTSEGGKSQRAASTHPSPHKRSRADIGTEFGKNKEYSRKN